MNELFQSFKLWKSLTPKQAKHEFNPNSHEICRNADEVKSKILNSSIPLNA